MDQSLSQGSSFKQPKHSMAFINRCCDHTPAAGAQSHSQSTQQAQQLQNHALPSSISDMPQISEGQVGFVPTHTSDQLTNGRLHPAPSKEQEDAASPSVHFFMMGADAQRGWRASHSWPPPHAGSPPLKLFLDKAAAPAAKATRSWFRNYRKPAQVSNTEDSVSQVNSSPSHHPSTHNRLLLSIHYPFVHSSMQDWYCHNPLVSCPWSR